jgi:hypothetical protein
MLAPKYYARSSTVDPALGSVHLENNRRPRRALDLLPALALVLCSTACASVDGRAAEAPRVPFAELPRRPGPLLALRTDPVVIVFEQGEHIPVRFDLDSSFIATTAHPLAFDVVATRRFFLLLLPDGHARTSLDGVHFDEKGEKYFRFGFAVDKESAVVDLGIGLRPPKRLTPPAR